MPDFVWIAQARFAEMPEPGKNQVAHLGGVVHAVKMSGVQGTAL